LQEGKVKGQVRKQKGIPRFDATLFFNCGGQRGRMEVGSTSTPPLFNYTHLESGLFRSMYGFSG